MGGMQMRETPSFQNFGRWKKARNPTILGAINNCPNPLESESMRYQVEGRRFIWLEVLTAVIEQ
jgi:hypothetical protein